MDSNSPFSHRLGTNYVPTAPEIDQLNQIITKRQVVVDALGTAITALDHQRKQLEAEMKIHTEYVDRHRDLTTIARRLPADVLSVIFATFLSLFPAHSSPHPSVTISHVCRLWRDLALETPLLWTQVAISTPRIAPSDVNWEDSWFNGLEVRCDQAVSFATRAKNCPLDISLTASDPDESICDLMGPEDSDDDSSSQERFYMPVLDAVERCAGSDWSRIRLNLRLNKPKPFSLVFLFIPISFHRNTPTLALDIACSNGDPLQDDSWQAIGETIDLRPALFTSVTLMMTPRDIRRLNATWCTLTDLTIGPPDRETIFVGDNALDILSLTPNLIRCCIEFSPHASTRAVPPGRQVILSKLRSLTIRHTVPCYPFSSALELPSLVRLSAADLVFVRPYTGGGMHSIDSLVQRWGRQLIDVALHYQCLTQSMLTSILQSVPNVQVLKLATSKREVYVPEPGATNPNNPASLEPMIQRFTPADGNSGTAQGNSKEDCLCPRLSELVIGLSKLTDEVRHDLVILVKARRSIVGIGGPVRRLERMTVGFDEASGLEDLRSDLEGVGVDTRGITLKVRSPETLTTYASSLEAL